MAMDETTDPTENRLPLSSDMGVELRVPGCSFGGTSGRGFERLGSCDSEVESVGGRTSTLELRAVVVSEMLSVTSSPLLGV